MLPRSCRTSDPLPSVVLSGSLEERFQFFLKLFSNALSPALSLRLVTNERLSSVMLLNHFSLRCDAFQTYLSLRPIPVKPIATYLCPHLLFSSPASYLLLAFSLLRRIFSTCIYRQQSTARSACATNNCHMEQFLLACHYSIHVTNRCR